MTMSDDFPGRATGTASETLRRAVEELRAGRPAEAKAACEAVLSQDPDNAQALHLLGALALEANDPARAVELLGAATRLDPGNPACVLDLAMAQASLGRIADATASYRQALALQPDLVPAHHGLGRLHQATGDLDQAVLCFRQATAIQPGEAVLHKDLGDALKAQFRREEAAASYRRALEIAPRSAGIWKDLGIVERQLGRLEESLGCFERAVAIDPGDAQTFNQIGMVHHMRGDTAAAAEAYRRAVAQRPDYTTAWSNLTRALIGRGEAAPALEAAEATLRLDPRKCSALADKAAALNELGRDGELRALYDYERLVQVSRLAPPPGYADQEAFNAKLAEAIAAHPTLRAEPEGKATRGGRQTGELFDGAVPFESLKDQLGDAVQAYLASLPDDAGHPFTAYKPVSLRITGWAVMLESQGFQIPHIHAESWVSGVYYVSVPPGLGQGADDKAGWLEFGRFEESFPLQASRHTHAVQPQPGRLVLFPAFFWHGTIPFEAEAPRICIAFDVWEAA